MTCSLPGNKYMLPPGLSTAGCTKPPLSESHSFMNENDESQWRKRSLLRSLSPAQDFSSAHTSSFHLAAKKCPGLPQGCKLACKSAAENIVS